MIDTHDNEAARLAAIRRKPHWARTDADWDDLDSEKQIACLERVAEKRRRGELPPLPPKSHTPKKSLLQACLEAGFIDARWERRLLTEFEADLQQAVAEINKTTKH